MKIAVAMLQQWHRENPARLLQAALSQAERLAQMAPKPAVKRFAAPTTKSKQSALPSLKRSGRHVARRRRTPKPESCAQPANLQ